MLKRILNTLDGVEANIQNLYQEKDGQFHLQVEELQNENENADDNKNDNDESEALKNLKRKKDIEAEHRRKAEAKLEQQKTEYDTHIASLQKSLNELLIDSNVQRIASELAVKGSSEALMPHIRQRLSVDVREGKHVPVVLDADGKPSALSLDELKTEIGNVAALAPLICGSKANGGGASKSGGGASGKKFSELSEQERSALYRADPARYRAARDAQTTQ